MSGLLLISSSTHGGNGMLQESPTFPPHWWKDMTAWRRRPARSTMRTSSA
uniref:Uncharacterized protein n=1 Tax=Arundo donax TaxID=35708 RepID=A0A0A9GQG7_ARUDO